MNTAKNNLTYPKILRKMAKTERCYLSKFKTELQRKIFNLKVSSTFLLRY